MQVKALNILIVSFSILFLGQALKAQDFTSEELLKAEAYFRGKLTTTPIAKPFRASEEEDVTALKDISPKRKRELIESALISLAHNEGVLAILAAGASTRMNPLEAPPEVKEILGGADIKSKASVPLGVLDGKVYTFLGAFLTNIAKLQEQMGKAFEKPIKLSVLIFSNDDYRAELDAQLSENNNFGLFNDQIIITNQKLGNQMIATPEDAEAASDKIMSTPEDKEKAISLSKEATAKFQNGDSSALMLKDEKAPLGHGEFFHQLISSGIFLKLYDQGKKWISVRNIDNSAATFDENWLITLALFLERKLDMQPEVSPRAEGQKGGSLIISGEQQILAEDPQIAVSAEQNLKADRQSYWFNNAVAIFSLDYLIDIYKQEGQSKADFIKELREADTDKLNEIADRGRKKFPILLDPKPARNSKAIAMKVETNMWQSTGIVSPEIKVKAVGVDGVFNIKDQFQKNPEQRSDIVKNLRFLATKQWQGPNESYESNKDYIEHMLRHITESPLFPEDIKLKF